MHPTPAQCRARSRAFDIRRIRAIKATIPNLPESQTTATPSPLIAVGCADVLDWLDQLELNVRTRK